MKKKELISINKNIVILLNLNKLLFVIPHYNNSNRLLRCLESINYFMGEPILHHILVIDDCSLALHKDKLDDIKDNYSIEVIYLFKNQGVSNARNIGINYAIEKNYLNISFIDCDDHLISKIDYNSFKDNELTIYNSIETLDQYESFKNFSHKIIKYNTFKVPNLSHLIKDYSLRPNKVTTLTSCWGKIFSVPLIMTNNIRFNIKMKTFEDVDFLMKYINFAKKVNFDESFIYAHTNNVKYLSASFGYNENINSMFSFLVVSRSLNAVFNKFQIVSYYNRYHFLACYYSISFIRIAINKIEFKQKIELYLFIKRRLKSRFVSKCFSRYDPDLAGGRRLIKFAVIYNLPLLLTAIVLVIASKRYGK